MRETCVFGLLKGRINKKWYILDKLFGPMDFTRRDLAALNIMRGRDNGLPDYNTVRRYFQLPVLTNWSQINPKLNEEKPQVRPETSVQLSLPRLYLK